MNPPGICDIEQLERDICKTPSFGRNSRARPNYCHRTSLINMLQRPEIRGGLSTPGRILCQINQQFVKPNYFGLEKWRGTPDHSTLLPGILLSGEGELGGWECCWCPARSLEPGGSGCASRVGRSSSPLEPAAPIFQANLGSCVPVADYFS